MKIITKTKIRNKDDVDVNHFRLTGANEYDENQYIEMVEQNDDVVESKVKITKILNNTTILKK